MLFRTSDVKKKIEMEEKGYKYLGMHTIYDGKKPSGKFEYEFEVPDEAPVELPEVKAPDILPPSLFKKPVPELPKVIEQKRGRPKGKKK